MESSTVARDSRRKSVRHVQYFNICPRNQYNGPRNAVEWKQNSREGWSASGGGAGADGVCDMTMVFSNHGMKVAIATLYNSIL